MKRPSPGGSGRGTPPIRGFDWAVLACLLLKVALARQLVLGEVGLIPFVVDAAFVVLVVGLTILAFGGRRAVPLLALDALLSVVMLSTVLYASFFEQVITPSALSLTGQVGEVRESVLDLVTPVHLLLVLDLPFLAVWLANSRAQAPNPRRWRPAALAVLAIMMIVFVVAVAAVVAVPGRVDSLAMARSRGMFAYQVASLMRDEDARLVSAVESQGDVAARPKSVSERIAELRDSQGAQRIVGAPAPGSAKGLDLIVVQFEALQTVCIDKAIDGVQVTPNLNEFAHESWYFPNTFAQIGKGNTSDAEFVGNASLLPPIDQPASVAYGRRIIPSLPSLLREQGYVSVTFHTNKASYWNRDQLYPALGFTRYYDAPFFRGEDVLGMGSTDRVLFKRTLQELKRIADSGTPYYANVITVTSHNPFNRLSKVRQKWYPGAPYADTFAGNYLSRINYSDKAFGEFVAGLKKSGVWDRAVVMVYGDHFGLKIPKPTGGAYDKALQALYGRPYTLVDRLTVPLMIHMPGQTEQQVVDQPVCQADVFPTAADLMGLDLSVLPHFGTSVFVRAKRVMPIPRYASTGAFVNDRVLYMPQAEPAPALAISLQTHQFVEPTEEDRHDAVKANELYALSLAYALSLPVRSGVETDTTIR